MDKQDVKDFMVAGMLCAEDNTTVKGNLKGIATAAKTGVVLWAGALAVCLLAALIIGGFLMATIPGTWDLVFGSSARPVVTPTIAPASSHHYLRAGFEILVVGAIVVRCMRKGQP